MEEGYRAYSPRPLPPVPGISLSAGGWQALSKAERALGRLDGLVDGLALPDGAHRWLARREAMASARLDGVPVRLGDLLESSRREQLARGPLLPYRRAKAAAARGRGAPEACSVLAAEHAIFDLCRRARRAPPRVAVLRELHASLVGAPERGSGPWRGDEIWIGPRGSTIHTARFVPPPPRLVPAAMEELDGYLQSPPEHAALVRAALVYHQLESIHPFALATGRVNRAFAAVLAAASGVAAAPLLSLSRYFLRDPGEYLGRLQGVREAGDWEAWTDYFLKGLTWATEETMADVQRIANLREHHRSMVREKLSASREPAEALLGALVERPVVSVSEVAALVHRTFANANQLVTRFEELGILRETTGQQRNRRYRYEEYYRVLRR